MSEFHPARFSSQQAVVLQTVKTVFSHHCVSVSDELLKVPDSFWKSYVSILIKLNCGYQDSLQPTGSRCQVSTSILTKLNCVLKDRLQSCSKLPYRTLQLQSQA